MKLDDPCCQDKQQEILCVAASPSNKHLESGVAAISMAGKEDKKSTGRSVKLLVLCKRASKAGKKDFFFLLFCDGSMHIFVEKIANLTSEKINFAYLTSNLHFLPICPQIHFPLPI